MEDRDFCVEQNVVILAKKEINKTDCEHYILDNLENFREGSKILILYGCHGSRDGTIGNVDPRLVGTMSSVKRKLEKRHGEKLKQRNITLINECIADSHDETKLDVKKLVNAIKVYFF